MARPKNMTVVVDGKVVSMKPSALKGLLAALSAGTVPTVDGTIVATLATTSNVTSLTPEQARVTLSQLFPTE